MDFYLEFPEEKGLDKKGKVFYSLTKSLNDIESSDESAIKKAVKKASGKASENEEDIIEEVLVEASAEEEKVSELEKPKKESLLKKILKKNNMTNEISIRCTYGTNVDVPLKGKFYDKKTRKPIVLLSNYKVAIDRELTLSERAFNYNFTKQNREFNFQWENSDTEKADFAKWLKQHPLIAHTDNKNKDATTYFALVDKSKQDELQYQNENSKVVVYQMLKNMTTKELVEVAFFSLINPSKLTALQLFNTLCGLTDGVLMKNPAKFLSEWNMPDVSKRVVIRKAILLDLIETHDGIFFINKSPIGNTDNLLVHLNDNEKYYEYLSKEVATKDTLPYDVAVNVSVQEALEKQKPKEKKDITLSSEQKAENKEIRESKQRTDYDRAQSQKNRLRELKVAGWQASESWSEEKRLEKISKAEAELTVPV